MIDKSSKKQNHSKKTPASSNPLSENKLPHHQKSRHHLLGFIAGLIIIGLTLGIVYQSPSKEPSTNIPLISTSEKNQVEVKSTSNSLLKKHAKVDMTKPTVQQTEIDDTTDSITPPPTQQTKEPTSTKKLQVTAEEHKPTVAQQAETIMHMTEAMEAVEQINQALAAIRISYLQLVNQQNPKTADDWLKLAVQPIKQAKLIDDIENNLLEDVTLLRQKVKALKQSSSQPTIDDLDTLQAEINNLASPVKTENIPVDQIKNNSDTETKSENTLFSLHSWYEYLHKVWSNSLIWVQNSVQIESISNAQYHTFQHTLGAHFFHSEATLLIQQASLAATFHDQHAFDYACAQLKSIVHFHIHEPKVQTQLLEKIDHIAKQSVQIVPPNYFQVIQHFQETLQQLHPHHEPTLPSNITDSSATLKQEPPTPDTKTQTESHTQPQPMTFLNIQETIT